MKRIHLLPLLIWSLLWGLFFATLLLGLERLPNSDLSGQFHAFGLFQAREIAAGRLPIWSPGSYGGIPFVADAQAAVFYPLRWLTILATLPTDFSYYALELEGLLHIWLAGVFTYFLAYDIVSDKSQIVNRKSKIRNRWAGLLAAVAFGLGGYLLSYPLLQLALLETITWLPLVLFLVRRGVLDENQNNVRYLLAAGVALGVSALAGHPQTFMHVSYLAAAYYLFLAWQKRWRWQYLLGLGAMMGVTAVGTAMAAFLPTLRFLPYTVRSDVSYEFVAKGFSLLDYLQTFVPGPLSLWQSQYVGLTAVFLAIFAWFARRVWSEKMQQAETIFWLVVVLLAAWLSLGDKGILFELGYRVLPGFSLFRQQERLVAWISLGLALLAAQGLALWWQTDLQQRRHLLRKTTVLLAVLLLLFGFMLAMMQSWVGWSWVAVWLRQIGFLLLTVVLLWPWPAKGWSNPKWQSTIPLLLVLLLSFDLYLTAQKPLNLTAESPAVFWPQPNWLDELPYDELQRFDGQSLFHTNLGELYGLEDIRGISPLKPEFTARFEQLPRPLRWQLLNVSYVLAEEPLETSLTEVAPINALLIPGEEADAAVYRFEDALPRAWMSYEPLILPDKEAAWQQLQQPDFDVTTQVILTAPEVENLLLSEIEQPTQAGQIDVNRPRSGALQINVQSEAPGILVISEWALPGWQATLDATAVPLLTGNTALQALYVPAGNHIVELEYIPWEVPLGIVISLLTLVVTAVVAWRWQPIILFREGKKADSTPIFTNVKAVDRGALARWGLIGIVLLGFGLRVFMLGNQELRGDEAFSYLYTLLPLDEVIPELIDEGDPHSPLHYLLLNSWTDAVGDSETALRYLSLVPGVLLLPLIYLLGAEMANRGIGLLAILFAALSPSLIWLAQDVRNQYMLALFFSTLATWLLLRATQADRHRLWWWAGYALSAALAVYGHYYAAFALLAHVLYLWQAKVSRAVWLAWVLSGLTAVILFLPWAMTVFSSVLNAGQLSDPSQPELTKYLTEVGVEMLLGPSVAGWWPRWLFLGAIVLWLYGGIVLWRRKPAWAAMLMGWLGLATLMIFLIRFSRSTFNPFYIAVAAPAWWLLLAVGAVTLWQGGRWRRLLIIVGVLLWGTAVDVSMRNYYFDPEFSRTRGLREAARIIQANAEPNDLFLAHFPDPALDYYLRDIDLPRQMLPKTVNETAVETEEALIQLATDYDRLWFIPYSASVWDKQNVVPNWLANNTLREMDVPAQRSTVQAWRPLPAAKMVIQPNDIGLDSNISLEGVFMTVNGRVAENTEPLPLAPGSTVDLTLLWTTSAPVPESYTAFVHLLDSNGALVTQHDGIPHNGQLPTPLWNAGEQVLDSHQLVVPEGVERNGRIVVGLYDSETLARLVFASGEDAVMVTAVAFE